MDGDPLLAQDLDFFIGKAVAVDGDQLAVNVREQFLGRPKAFRLSIASPPAIASI
jgi:hypothetical protein